MRNMPNRLIAYSILQDERDGNILYLGTNYGVYRSTDKGYSWERLDAIAGAELPTTRIWTLSFDPFERDRIYAGSFSSGVYVLTFQRGAANASK